MFLIRTPPIQGESLSSWRQRTGQANGFWRYPRHNYRGKNNDPDRIISTEEESWLAEQFGCDQATLAQLTLDFELGKYLRTRNGANQLRGALSHAGPSSRPGGHPMYCPTCLASDPIPYFRTSWRIAFNTRCPIHGCSLREACPNCGQPPWPSTIRKTEFGRWLSHRFCQACGADLGQNCATHLSNQSKRAHRIQRRIADEYGSALWFVSQLFLRNGTHDLLLHAFSMRGTQYHERSLNSHRLEFLDVQHREELLDAADWLLQKWPKRFVSGALYCGLNVKDLSGSLHIAPDWVQNGIMEHLSKRRRLTSPWR